MKQKINQIIKFLKEIINIIKEKILENKKITRIILIIVAILLVTILIVKIIENKRLEMEKNTDVSNSIHSIVINDNVVLYKKPKESFFNKIFTVEKGDKAYILESYVEKENTHAWYKVKCNDRIGYIIKENLDYYIESDEEKVLMSDVSKFNVIYKHFKKAEDYEIFLLKHDIQYVYIRAGGRGYGDEGNFYTDPNFDIFIEACEYLKVPYGFYYIDEATNSEEVDEEIKFMKDFISQNSTSMNKLPLAIDIETHDGKGRADEMWEDRVYLAEELVQKFRLEGINTIIYSNAKTANEYLWNANSNFWIAYYPDNNSIPNYWYSDTDQEPTENLEFMEKVIAWQFTESGVDGKIEEKLDVNLVKNDFFKQFVK